MQAKDAHFRNPPKAFLLRKKGGGTKKKGASSGKIQTLTPKNNSRKSLSTCGISDGSLAGTIFVPPEESIGWTGRPL